MQDLNWEFWDAKSRYRSIHNVVPEKINMALECYGSKIPHLERTLIEERGKFTELLRIVRAEEATLDGLEEIANLTRKINRLKDKRITCEKELEGRDLGTIVRDFKDFHFTVYYIDLDAGNDGNTGLDAAGEEWLTLAQYTTTTVRTAGDIAYVRANTDETMAAVLNCDEDGNQDAFIEIIGCDDVTNDPWSDGSAVKPILTFGDSANNWQLNTDNYWKITRMVVKEANLTTGNLYVTNSRGTYLLNSEFTDNPNASGMGVLFNSGFWSTVDGCTFQDNLGSGTDIRYSWVRFKSCTFNGGGTTTDYGIKVGNGSHVECVDSSFGQTTSHDTSDIRMIGNDSILKCRNNTYDSASHGIDSVSNVVFDEDNDGTYGAGYITHYHGTIEKDTAVKTGNANFSFKMLPNTNVGPNAMLTLNNESIIDYPFVTYHAKDSEITLTVKIRAVGTWGTYPTAAQLYMETSYLSNGATAARAVDTSTEVLSHASDWVSFTTTFTPLQAGLAYTTIKFGIFEDAGDGCYVNGEIAAS